MPNFYINGYNKENLSSIEISKPYTIIDTNNFTANSHKININKTELTISDQLLEQNKRSNLNMDNFSKYEIYSLNTDAYRNNLYNIYNNSFNPYPSTVYNKYPKQKLNNVTFNIHNKHFGKLIKNIPYKIIGNDYARPEESIIPVNSDTISTYIATPNNYNTILSMEFNKSIYTLMPNQDFVINFIKSDKQIEDINYVLYYNQEHFKTNVQFLEDINTIDIKLNNEILVNISYLNIYSGNNIYIGHPQIQQYLNSYYLTVNLSNENYSLITIG